MKRWLRKQYWVETCKNGNWETRSIHLNCEKRNCLWVWVQIHEDKKLFFSFFSTFQFSFFSCYSLLISSDNVTAWSLNWHYFIFSNTAACMFFFYKTQTSFHSKWSSHAALFNLSLLFFQKKPTRNNTKKFLNFLFNVAKINLTKRQVKEYSRFAIYNKLLFAYSKAHR